MMHVLKINIIKKKPSSLNPFFWTTNHHTTWTCFRLISPTSKQKTDSSKTRCQICVSEYKRSTHKLELSCKNLIEISEIYFHKTTKYSKFFWENLTFAQKYLCVLFIYLLLILFNIHVLFTFEITQLYLQKLIVTLLKDYQGTTEILCIPGLAR